MKIKNKYLFDLKIKEYINLLEIFKNEIGFDKIDLVKLNNYRFFKQYEESVLKNNTVIIISFKFPELLNEELLLKKIIKEKGIKKNIENLIILSKDWVKHNIDVEYFQYIKESYVKTGLEVKEDPMFKNKLIRRLKLSILKNL